MATSSAPPTAYSSTRLYVGNLAATVDEYCLIQTCSKHGKITKLDYLFHKAGPLKNKPRGYAFVEYDTKQEALRAMVALHDMLLRGKKLVVTAAAEQTYTADDARLGALGSRSGSSSSSSYGKRGGPATDAHKPTTISLIKGQGVAGASTNKKIALLEAKLLARQRSKLTPSSSRAPSPAASKGVEDVATAWLASTGIAGDSLENGKGKERSLDQQESSETLLSSSVSSATNANGRVVVTGLPEVIIAVKEGSRIKVDLSKAGLPVRPYFDAVAPDRRGS